MIAATLAGTDVCFTRFPFTWDTGTTHFRHPLDFIGYDGGSGIGSGPGITVGAGLALRGSGRLPVAVLGDGDFLMGNTALWTAAHSGIPCLFVVCNNRSFHTDERHQAHVALHAADRSTPGASARGSRIPRSISWPWPARWVRWVWARSTTRPASPPRSRRPSRQTRSGRPCVIDVHVARALREGPSVPPVAAAHRWRRRVGRYLRR